MPQLDGLRTIAVAAVFYHHWINEAHDSRFSFGAAGVQLFFVLSGYLITGILLLYKDADRREVLMAFYARRFLRIFPLYYAVVFTVTALNCPGARETFSANVAYVFNFKVFATGDWFGSVAHFWSLCVEEQFYIVWPVIVLLTPRRYLMPLFVAVIAASTVSRQSLIEYFPKAAVLPTSNMDALVLGALFSLLGDRGSKLAWLCLVAGSVLMATGIATGIDAALKIGFVAFAGWLIFSAARGFSGPFGSFLELPPMLWLGKISYGLYVIHNFMPDIAERIHRRIGVAMLEPAWIEYAVLTIIAASTSWYLFERPINDLKRHFPYSRERQNQ